MKGLIIEIFSSIQGEGKYVGAKHVFVRFYKCNIHCHWCDTPASIGDRGGGAFQEYTIGEVMEKIRSLKDGCQSVALTGGEPLLQADFIKVLAPEIKKAGLKRYLDTNGICHNELAAIIDDVDTIAMDIKMPSSTKCLPCWDEHTKFLHIAVKKDTFIKAVVTMETAKEDVKRAVDLVASINPQVTFILQPNYFEIKKGIIPYCLDLYKICAGTLADVRIIPQIHKFLQLR